MWTDKQFMQEIEKMANSNSEGSKAAQDTLKEILAAEAKGEKLSDAIDSIEKKVISSGMRKQTKCGFGGSLIGLGIFAGLFQWIQQLWLMKLLGRRRSGRLSTIDDSLLDGSGAESGTDIDDGSTILSRLWQRHQKLARPRRRIIELENGQKRIVNQQPVTQFVGTARPATTSQMLPEIIQPETNRLIPEQPFTTVLTGESVTPGGTIRRVFEERPSSSRTVLRQPTEPLVTDFIREVPSICTTFMQEGRRPNQPLHTTTRTFSNTTPPLDTRTTLPISSKTRYANPITSLAQTTRNLQPLDDQLETQIRRQPPSLVTLPIPESKSTSYPTNDTYNSSPSSSFQSSVSGVDELSDNIPVNDDSGDKPFRLVREQNSKDAVDASVILRQWSQKSSSSDTADKKQMKRELQVNTLHQRKNA